MTTRAELRDTALAALRTASALAGIDVLGSSAVSTSGAGLPVLLVQMPAERKSSLGRGMPMFTTVVQLVVVARVAGSKASQVEADLDRIVDAVQAALLTSHGLLQIVQQFSEVETRFALTGEARALVGEAEVIVHCELFQRYDPAPGTAVNQIDLQLTRPGSGRVLAEADLPLGPL